MKRAILTYNQLIKYYKNEKAALKATAKFKDIFPIYPDSILAGIIADLMGDGHIQGPPLFRMDYCSNSTDELNRFNEIIKLKYNVEGKIRKCSTNKYGTMNLGINNKALTRIFILLDVPYGSKVNKPIIIPKWILNNKKCFAKFINRLYSCEGTVDISNRSKSIDIKMHKNIKIINKGFEFFETIKFYLYKHFKIISSNPFLAGTTLRKDGEITAGVRIKIKRKNSIKKFKKYIGIEDKIKNKKLNLITE